MRRVLLITYHFPPRPASGSLRPMGLAKHLPRYGWEPIVLTPRLPDGPRPAVQIIETHYQDVLGQWKSRFGLDPSWGPIAGGASVPEKRASWDCQRNRRLRGRLLCHPGGGVLPRCPLGKVVLASVDAAGGRGPDGEERTARRSPRDGFRTRPVAVGGYAVTQHSRSASEVKSTGLAGDCRVYR